MPIRRCCFQGMRTWLIEDFSSCGASPTAILMLNEKSVGRLKYLLLSPSLPPSLPSLLSTTFTLMIWGSWKNSSRNSRFWCWKKCPSYAIFLSHFILVYLSFLFFNFIAFHIFTSLYIYVFSYLFYFRSSSQHCSPRKCIGDIGIARNWKGTNRF